MTIETHRYRADIDGLRALAIVPVVLYHAGVPGFSGGFIGVDVFFVISGYLITSIIEREIRENRFSLVGFYERRVRRILPALFVMMAACAIASVYLLFPVEYRSFARSLITATLFVSSVQFRREGGYFDVDAEQKPLLHTWSLSVEEIFYVFFPVLSILLWRCCRAHRVSLVWAVAILSFVGCAGALYLNNESRAAFFLAHFRAWEFLIGALLALSTMPALHRRRSGHVMSAVGVLMIAVAAIAYSDATTFPGMSALLPCLGAAFFILAGQHRPSLAGQILSHRPFVFTGLISYSLYLWHWPVLVFAGLWLGRKPSGWETAALIAASFALATLSWRYVERPFRGKSGWLSRQKLFALSAGLGLLMVAIGLHGEITKGWLSRYPDALRGVLESVKDRDSRQKECLSRALATKGCIYGQQSRPPTVALWGDSHAAVYAVMLGQMAQARGESILTLTLPSCPPVLGWQIEYQTWRKSCEQFQQLAIQKILDTESIHTVVLAANYSTYAGVAKKQEGFSVALYDVVDRLLGAGKRVFVVYPFPQFDAQTLKALARAAADGKDLNEITQPLQAFLQGNQRAFDLLDKLGERPRQMRIQPHTGLCDDRRCFVYKDGRAFYYDAGHLSLTGAEAVSSLFEPIFEDRRGGTR